MMLSRIAFGTFIGACAGFVLAHMAASLTYGKRSPWVGKPVVIHMGSAR